MHRTLSLSRKSPRTHPGYETRTHELAQLLIHAFGYDQAMEQARRSNWDQVAQAIHFMLSKGFNRF